MVAIAAVLAFIVYHSVTPWGWTGDLRTPAGVPAASVNYSCGALWGSPYVHGPEKLAYPIQGTPCGARSSYQVLTGVDALLGVFAIAVIVGWKRVRTPSLS